MLPAEQESRETSRKLLRHTNGASKQSAKLFENAPDHSVGLFKKLQQSIVKGNEEKARLLSAIDTDTSGKISTVVIDVSDLKILPSESDVRNLLTTDPDMVEEEEELYHFGSMRIDHGGASQAVLSKVERQAMVNEIKKEERAMVNEIEKKEKNMVGEIEAKTKSREEAIMNEIETKAKSREEASIAREKAMMNEMKEEKTIMMNEIKRMSNTEDALFRELRETREEKSRLELKAMHFQLASLTLVCVGISIGAFFALRRN